MIPDWFFTLLRNKLCQNSISQAKRSLPICKQTKALENILSFTYLNKFLNFEISEQSFDFWVLWGEICLSKKESLQNKQISTCYYSYKYLSYCIKFYLRPFLLTNSTNYFGRKIVLGSRCYIRMRKAHKGADVLHFMTAF